MPNKRPDADASPVFEIPRPRLDALLDAALQGPLVVLQAGAGFGKTRALEQHLPKTEYRTVWHSLSALDNIPARFWENLAHTFALHRPGLGEKMRREGFPEDLHAFGNFLAGLTGELYHDERSVVFVFDDLHLLTEASVQAFLANLVSAKLENSCIVFATRQWPVFGQALPVVPHIIDAADLRFSLEETKTMLDAAGLPADSDVADTIHRYVAGWPIAMSLVVLGLRREGAAVLDSIRLSGAKPMLYALFEREIFSQYTPSEQDAITKLSVLESFPRGLVHAITGERERDIGQLLNANVFIRYDADARRLSFHPLYREYLREKLYAVSPEQTRQTYQKAAEWCRENGHYYDAVEYYGQCGCYQELWDTLLRIAAFRHAKSEADFFIHQIQQLPQDFRQSHPMAGIVLATMLVNNLRLAEAAQTLDDVEEQLAALEPGPQAQQWRGEYHIARGFLILAMEQNGFEAEFKQAAQLLPGGSSRWGRSLRLIDMGPGLNLQSAKAGELKKSLACFTEGVPYMQQVLHGAGRGLDMLCSCEALFLTGEVKAAAEPAYQALYAAEAASQYDIVGNALFMLLRIYTALGDYAQILDTLEHVRRYEAQEAAKPLGIWDVARGWFYAEMDEVERVAVWVRNPIQNGFAPISIDRPTLVRLRCLVAAGQYGEALALVEQYEVLAKSKSAVITQLYLELGRAVTHHYLGHYGDATQALKTAYHLAKGNKLVMPFIEYGHRTRSLLEKLRATPGHGLPQAWVEETLAKAGTYAKRHAYLSGRYRQEQQGRLTDYALSARERELLANLSQGLTREEMADSMELSLNTIKSLTKQVFAKLGAINAADAVRIAIVNQLI